jgi:hypothetical protein
VPPTAPQRARALWRLLEPIHAVTYFAPEPVTALKEAGYRGYWMGYFAQRAAPLGPAGPQVVHALFYNFAYDRVARALPAAWEFAAPAAALDARLRGSVAALERSWGDRVDPGDVERAADLATRIVTALPLEGRVLFAANHALPVPDEPVARLWHAATLVREHRGDGHVATLLARGIGGRESHVWHALNAGIPREVYTVARDFTDEEWATRRGSLADRGLVDGDGLSAEGARLKAEVEDRTDVLAGGGLAALTDDEHDELVALLRPLTVAVVTAGDLPLDSPMGLDLRELTGS